MTRTFTYTFTVVVKRDGTDGHKQSDWTRKSITLKKRVTDRMEERDYHKAGYAAEYFNRVLRTEYGYNKSIVTAVRVKEI